MVKKYLIIISIALSLVACERKSMFSNRVVTHFSNEDFGNEVNIKTELATFNYDSLVTPSKCIVIGDHFLVIDQKGTKPIHVFDVKNNSYLGGYGKMGQGPGEVAMPWIITYDSQKLVYLYDVGGRKILSWSIDSLINNKPPVKEFKFNEEGITYSLSLIQNDIYFTDIMNPKGRFFKYNTLSKQFYNYGNLLANTKNVAEVTLSQANRSVIAANREKIVIANHIAPFFEIYDTLNKQWKSILGPEDFEPIFAEAQAEGIKRFAITKESRLGNIGLETTDKYIYILFSGELVLDNPMDVGKEIHIFTYDGKPVKRLVLDKFISCFSVYNDSIIYAISTDIRPEIVTFSVN